MSSSPSKILEVFDNPNSDRDFVIRINSSEFTCLCPLTGQPDFADFKIGRVKSKKNQAQMVRLFSQLLYYLSGVYGIMVWTD